MPDMTPTVTPLTRSDEWQALRSHRDAFDNFSLRSVFEREPDRFARYSVRWQDDGLDWLFDYSKHRIDAQTMPTLVALAKARGVAERRQRMFDGERINATEGRAVLHTALRDLSGRSIEVDGQDVMADIAATRERFLAFAEQVRSGAWRGHTGETITDVVNLGIGGSDLGPQMVVEALAPYHDGPRTHFVSNVDGAHIGSVLRTLDPKRTLFVIASKTFTTIETMTNAHTARAWLIEGLGDEAAVAKHAVAVSTNAKAVSAFGISTDSMFGFWDWVGGRYSLWSSVGVSIALAVGRERFMELLGGAHAMDKHFQHAPFERNLPVLMGVLGIWYANFWNAASHTIAPYYQHLSRFVAHIQQVDMESNGKRVTLDGKVVDHATGPVIWGEPGTNGQHAYFQLLHQGPALIPVDFLVAAESSYPHDDHHRILVANCFAQSAALLHGKTAAEARAEMIASGISETDADRLAMHREFPGNRPSSTLLVRRFDPRTVGALTALYEHKTFVQGAIWGVNSFDQWGVELGKKIATRLGEALDGNVEHEDASTAGLIDTWRTMRAAGTAQVGG